MRAIAEESVSALAQSVGAHMTREVTDLRQFDTIEDLMETMTRGRFRHVPVVNDDRLVGIVLDRRRGQHRIAERRCGKRKICANISPRAEAPGCRKCESRSVAGRPVRLLADARSRMARPAQPW